MFGPGKKDEAKYFCTAGSGGVRYFSFFVLSAWVLLLLKKSCLKETFYFIVIDQILLADRSAFIRDFEAAPHSVFKTVHK